MDSPLKCVVLVPETLWVDSDVVFHPDDVERLRAHNRPFTLGIYPKKGPKEFAGKFRADAESITFGVGGGLVEVEYFGFGFAHVRREVYRAIRSRSNLPTCGGGYEGGKPIVPYFLPMVAPTANGWDYLSEDYAFCYRARQAGFPPFADTTIRLGHVGRHTYTWDDVAPRTSYETLTLDVVQPERAGIGIATRKG